MADSNFKGTGPTPELPEDKEPVYLFSHSREWTDGAEAHVSGRMALELAKQAQDVASGVALVLELLQRDDIEHEMREPQPILNNFYRGRLHQLALTSCSLLGDKAEAFISSADTRARAGGAA